MRTFRSILVSALLLLLVLDGQREAAGDDAVLSENAIVSIKKYCVECHQGESPAGEIRLNDVTGLPLDTQISLLNRAQEQIFFGLMPPESAEPLDREQRAELVETLSAFLRRHE